MPYADPRPHPLLGRRAGALAVAVLSVSLLGAGLVAPTYAAAPTGVVVSGVQDTAFEVTVQPEPSVEVTSGTESSLTSEATGTPTPTVVWQVSTDQGDSFTDIPGATSTTYTFTPTTADDGQVLRAHFTSGADTTDSDVSYLTVSPSLPVVTAQPADVTVPAGQDATFTVDATGDPTPGVQWQELGTDPDADWTDIDDATSSSFTVPAPTLDLSGWQYRAVLTNDAGDVTSDAATLTVEGSLASAPVDVKASVSGPGAVDVTWRAPFGTGSPGGITGYVVGYGTGQSGSGVQVGPTARSLTLSDLPTGDYSISVSAVNAAGNGPQATAPGTYRVFGPAPSLTISDYDLVAGQRLRLSGLSQPGSTVRVERALPGRGFTVLSSVTAASDGSYSWSGAVTRTASYRTRTIGADVNEAQRVVVRTRVTMGARRVARRTYVLSGVVSPALSGQVVRLYQSTSRGYAYLGYDRADSRGRWSLKRRFGATTTYTLKAVSAATSLNGSGSVVRRVAVR